MKAIKTVGIMSAIVAVITGILGITLLQTTTSVNGMQEESGIVFIFFTDMIKQLKQQDGLSELFNKFTTTQAVFLVGFISSIVLFLFSIIYMAAPKNVALLVITTIITLTLIVGLAVFLINYKGLVEAVSDRYYAIESSDNTFVLAQGITINIILISLSIAFSGIFLVLVIVKYVKENKMFADTTKVSKKSKNQEMALNQVTSQKNFNNNELNPDFTSSPNDNTVNVQDKIAVLKNQLEDADFKAPAGSDTIDTVQLVDSIKKEETELQREVEELNRLKMEQQKERASRVTGVPTQESHNKVTPESVEQPREASKPTVNQNVNKEPKDPYKETIVPRRAQDKAKLYSKPIGNTSDQVKQINKERHARYDESYQGQVFLGDSDRIWEAMKKQDRNVTPKKIKDEHIVSPSNIVNGLHLEKNNTIEDPLNKEMQKNEEEKAVYSANPTIDWGE